MGGTRGRNRGRARKWRGGRQAGGRKQGTTITEISECNLVEVNIVHSPELSCPSPGGEIKVNEALSNGDSEVPEQFKRALVAGPNQPQVKW
ncbi:hypothetical protein RHGRI_031232 [Rhododendron griersonianum]|uniref:Uncharacterized protein n=1 Tax=Rhododendron griersonianum TaxID=479676 RepID=A0AAV6I781_9ERIC|nr:hypothetical protein RHGRI_031232 [Rhododendron griersonianum]